MNISIGIFLPKPCPGLRLARVLCCRVGKSRSKRCTAMALWNRMLVDSPRTNPDGDTSPR